MPKIELRDKNSIIPYRSSTPHIRYEIYPTFQEIFVSSSTSLSNDKNLNIREEAAAAFSGSDPSRALDLLVSYLNSHYEDAPQSVWFMLMDGYKALNRQKAFNACAKMFASYFKTSPPSWDEVEVKLSEAPASSKGAGVLIIDGPISQMESSLLKSFIKATKDSKEGTLDLSRASLSDDEVQRIDDISILLKFMRRLRRNEVSVLLMGENQLVETLRAIVSKNLPLSSLELYWELVLEFLQWRGQKDSFEEMAIMFGRHFSRSAPGFEDDGVVAIPPQEKIEELVEINVIRPHPFIDEDYVQSWCEEISMMLPSEEDVLRVDFSQVHRITYKAAQYLAGKLLEWDLPVHNIVFVHPSELISALLEISGISGMVSIEPRRR